MKVLIPFWKLEIIDRYYPQFNALAREISELIILYETGTPPEDMEPNVSFLKFTPPASPHRYLSWWLGKSHSHLCTQITRWDIDAVYSLSGLWMNIYGHEIAEIFGIPHIIRMRGSMTETRKYNGKGRIQNLLFSRLHERALRSATLITSIVQKYIPYLKEIGLSEEQIGEVIPNGVGLRAFPQHPDTFTPGYAGRISKEKGSEFLLKLIKETPDLTWKVTGEIQDLDFVPPSNCHYLGKTPFAEMDTFYDQVSLLVQPSHTEGFPNILLESFVNGKVVIGSLDAYPEEVAVYGDRLPLDLDLWVDSLNRWDNMTRGLRYNHGNNAREYAEMFTWDNHGSRIAGQIEKAISMNNSLSIVTKNDGKSN